MTSRHPTGLFSLPGEVAEQAGAKSFSDRMWQLGFGAIGWPWLLYSLWGGTKASKRLLLDRIGLADDALPHLGSWKADTGFLHRIVDAIEELRPRHVVELGAGASSLVAARALALHGGGQLHSYDQHSGFVTATANWLAEEGAAATLRHAPLTAQVEGWPGRWYDVTHLPDSIDLLIIDGPPWSVHPLVRGAADCLFDRLTPGAIVLLDDAARPGERMVARRWRQRWGDMQFVRLGGSTKGTLMGRKAQRPADVLPFPDRTRVSASAQPMASGWRRAAAIALIFASGWMAHGLSGEFGRSAQAASFVDEAHASHAAGLTRQTMASQAATPVLDRAEIRRMAGLELPQLPAGWTLSDVQLFPSDLGMAVNLVAQTAEGDQVSLFAARAETPAEDLPLMDRREGDGVAYWEAGPYAYALVGKLPAGRLRELAGDVADNDAADHIGGSRL